jgi:hypothetical protein
MGKDPNKQWARDYRAGQGGSNLQNSTQRHLSGGGSTPPKSGCPLLILNLLAWWR